MPTRRLLAHRVWKQAGQARARDTWPTQERDRDGRRAGGSVPLHRKGEEETATNTRAFICGRANRAEIDGTQRSQCKGRKHHGEVKAKEELCTILPGCIGHRMIPPVLGPFAASTQGLTLMDKPVTLTQVFLAAPHPHNRLTGHHTPCAGIAKCHNNHSQLFPMPPAAPSCSVQETTAQLDIPSSEPAVPRVLPGTCSPMAPAAAPTPLTWAF